MHLLGNFMRARRKGTRLFIALTKSEEIRQVVLEGTSMGTVINVGSRDTQKLIVGNRWRMKRKDLLEIR